MSDIDFELIGPSAPQANDAVLVRRGAAAPNSGALTLTADLLSRANHTGTQLAATISDLASAVASTPAVTANTAKVTNAAHTGDATGSGALTLATVNGNVGGFGSATQVATFTVNAKGLTTAAANVSIQLAEAQVTGLTAALAAKQPLDADLTALAALTGTNTIYYRSAADTWTPVTIGANLTFAAGTLAAAGGGGGVSDGDKGDVIVSGTGTIWAVEKKIKYGLPFMFRQNAVRF